MGPYFIVGDHEILGAAQFAGMCEWGVKVFMKLIFGAFKYELLY